MNSDTTQAHTPTVVITGATSGLGYETALALAKLNWLVVLTGRNDEKGQRALHAIKAQRPDAQVFYAHLDVSHLASVAAFVAHFKQHYGALDVLINNAGVMALPHHHVTADGFELQLATNYLGHFALSAQLLPLLRQSPVARVVNLSSIAHRRGRIAIDDIHGQHRYRPMDAYAQSKLAMLLFALELQRRSDRHGWGLTSLAAHPGIADTPLFFQGPGNKALWAKALQWLLPFISQSSYDGALPIVLAATAPDVSPGGYYGPQGFREIKGKPGVAVISKHAQNIEIAQQLWALSERLTQLEWPTH